MPCVCLINTFARRQSLKAQKYASRNYQPQHNPTPSATMAAGESIHIAHPRPTRSATESHELEDLIAQRQQEQQSNFRFRRSAVHLTRADLINAESRLGSTIFGPIPAGHRREFFHDQNNVWIWHEDWYDGQNNPHQLTVRYEVRTSGIYKKVATGKYFKLEGEELENFRRATHVYLDVVKKNLYNHPKLAPLK